MGEGPCLDETHCASGFRCLKKGKEFGFPGQTVCTIVQEEMEDGVPIPVQESNAAFGILVFIYIKFWKLDKKMHQKKMKIYYLIQIKRKKNNKSSSTKI